MAISNNLIAYALIASKIDETQSVFSAFVPFVEQVMKRDQNTIFVPSKISVGIEELFGIRIPELALEGMLSSFVEIGFLKKNAYGKNAHYHANIDLEDLKGSELESEFEEKETVRKIYDYVIEKLNSKNIKTKSEDSLKNDIMDALIHPKLWYGDKEWSKSAETSNSVEEVTEFHTLEYCLMCHDNDQIEFNNLSKIAMGGLAVSFLSAFDKPSVRSTAHRAEFFLDTRILASYMGVADRAKEIQLKSVIEQVLSLGAYVSVLSETASELHSILLGASRSIGEGSGQDRSIDRRLRSDSGALLRAEHFLKNPEAHIKSIGLRYVDVEKSYSHIMKNFTRKNTEEFITRIRVHKDVGARDLDAQYIAHIGRFLRHANRACYDLFQMPAVFVSDNYEVVNEANKYLKELRYFQDGQCPPCIMHSHLAAAAWISSGSVGTEIAKENLIANCMALVDANSDLFRNVSFFLRRMDPEDAVLFESSISNDRSALMVASEFVGTAMSIEERVSADLLSDIVASREAELKRRYEFKTEEKEALHESELEKIREESMAEIEKLRAEKEKDIDDLEEANSELARFVENLEEREKDNEKINMEKFEDLEKRLERSQRKGRLPYFIGGTVIMIVLSNQLGIAEFSSDESPFFGLGWPKYIWATLTLVVVLILNFILIKQSDKI